MAPSTGIAKIALYDEGAGDSLDIAEIAGYLRGVMGAATFVEQRGSLFASELPPDRVTQLARSIAGAKVQDVHHKLETAQEPLYGEVEFEKRRVLGRSKAFGIPYDGLHLQRAFREAIARTERRLNFVHIVFTNRLLATWDAGDRRYHLRTGIYGTPSIVSTSGVVEAPAKPREYYLLKQQYEALRKDPTELKAKFAGEFIDYDDERMTEVVKGLTMQAIFNSLTGEPFCGDRGCRLYNAHWQADLIHAQLKSEYEFCQRHRQILAAVRRGETLT